jgi:hypothetical protein
MKLRIWVDDIRKPPESFIESYLWVASVDDAKSLIETIETRSSNEIELLDLDHDAGSYASKGGDYIEILNWMEQTGRSYHIRIHSMNPVGGENMRRIIQRNGWTEVR